MKTVSCNFNLSVSNEKQSKTSFSGFLHVHQINSKTHFNAAIDLQWKCQHILEKIGRLCESSSSHWASKSSETPDVNKNHAGRLIRNQLSTDVLCLRTQWFSSCEWWNSVSVSHSLTGFYHYASSCESKWRHVSGWEWEWDGTLVLGFFVFGYLMCLDVFAKAWHTGMWKWSEKKLGCS